MTPIDWYFARGSKQMGPVSSVELKRLAGAGELRPDDLVWREGLAEWTLARNVQGLFEVEAKPAAADDASPAEAAAAPAGAKSVEKSPQPAAARAGTRHPIDVLLDSLRSGVSARLVEATARLLRQCGLYGLLAAMALVLVFALVEVAKGKALGGVAPGAVMLLLLLAVLHYVAAKCCDALDRLNGVTHGSLASAVLPNCIAILSLVAGVATLIGSVAVAVESSAVSAMLPGLVASVVCVYLAFVALNPTTLNVLIAGEDAAASEEAIGTLTFLVKALLAAAPVAFGAGVVCSALLMGVACGLVVSGDEQLLAAQMTAAAARVGLIYFGTLPLAAYLLFLLCFLVLGIWRAVLSMPEKLDKLATKDDGSEGT